MGRLLQVQWLWVCALVLAVADAIPTPLFGWDALDNQLLADAADGRLDDFDFLSAALVASGTDDACELQQWRGRYDEAKASIVRQLDGASASDRLTRIHATLHERVLHGRYQATATDLRIALARGDFNCLSALALYFDLCSAAGLELEIWLLPGHVCLRCPDSDLGWIEPGVVQPRRSLELNPGHKPPISISTARVPSRQVLPAAARQITRVELLGKFYYNRGVQKLHERQYEEGLALLQTAMRLDPADRDARENLLAGFNNWAVEQCRARQYRRAADLIAEGLALDARYTPLVANQRLVNQKLRP